MKRVVLSLIGGVWHARFQGVTEILEAFGTELVPTPFTAAMPAERVIVEVLLMFDDFTVVIERGEQRT